MPFSTDVILWNRIISPFLCLDIMFVLLLHRKGEILSFVFLLLNLNKDELRHLQTLDVSHAKFYASPSIVMPSSP